MKKKAFTLAEVLLTLTIIGIISSMTIPALVQSTNEAELKTAWVKAFSNLSQSMLFLTSQGEDIDWTSHSTMRSSFAIPMNFIKEDSTNNIFASFYRFYKSIQSNQGWSASSDTAPSAVLNDGTLLRFWSFENNGGAGVCTASSGSILTTICGFIYVDVNGTKSPNMYGKDLFVTWVVKKQGVYVVYPMGSQDDGYTCVLGSTSNSTSEGCSARALYSENLP